MKKITLTIILLFLLSGVKSFAQSTPTAEDSLNRNLSSLLSHTSIGGYGNALYQNNTNLKTSFINLERFVLFVGHQFSKKISFFSELEVEDAKVSGGEEGGEIALEQCYVKFNINPTHYFVAGLFLPRIGILNENHLSNTFFGNERTQVETFILPSTWRELGIGFYGTENGFPLTYSVGLVNGLNSAAFEHGSGIREGRFEGRNASANNLAITGALQINADNLKFQVSGYYGGSVGLAPREADSLKLVSGTFGTPVIIGEADLQYSVKGFSAKLLASIVAIPDAADINRAYASNAPKREYGAYAEVGYNLFHTVKKLDSQELVVFVRYEKLDMNAEIPLNGIMDETLNQQHIVAGLNYLPVKNVVLKADVRLVHTGKENPDLIINPSPVAPPYQQDNTLFNLGIGFAF